MPTDAAPKPVGLILAGGRASRLGGGDKMLRTIGGRTILARIADVLAPQCDGLVLSLNGNPARLPGWSAPIVADHPEDAGCGPLAGLLAGLDWVAARRPEVDAVVTVPSDVPFLPDDLAPRFAIARGAGHPVAFARSGGRDHPLASLWPVTVRHRLRTLLREGDLRRVGALLDTLGAVAVDWPATPRDPFLNVNTPDDVRAAERLHATR